MVGRAALRLEPQVRQRRRGVLRPIAGTTDLLEWTWPSLPASPFAFSYVLGVPESSAGDKQVSALVSLQGADATVQITAKPGPLIELDDLVSL